MDISTVLQNWPLQAVAAIVAGVVVLLAPRILNYVVAVYLLVVGTLRLVRFFYGHSIRAQALLALVAGVLILVRPTILSYVVGFYLVAIGLLESGILRF